MALNKDGKPFGFHKKKEKAEKIVKQNYRGKEHLVSCAIIRDGETYSFGERSHGAIRLRLGDEDAYENYRRPNDIDGFMTSTGRFLNRQDAREIAEAAGQWYPTSREMLSSDINW